MARYRPVDNQPCFGVATVHAAHRVIVDAQAHGTGSEQALPLPAVRSAQEHMSEDTVVTADGSSLGEQPEGPAPQQEAAALHAAWQTKVEARFKLFCLVHKIEPMRTTERG